MSKDQDPSEDGTLWALFSVKPHEDADCAVIEEGMDADSVTQHIKSNGERGECHTEIVCECENETESSYVTSSLSDNCICPVFDKHDCIPDIKSVNGDRILLSVTVCEHSNLRGIIKNLKEKDAAVELEQLTRENTEPRTVEIEAKSITQKQKEAMELAVRQGYYENPKKADLEDIASKLDISKSAVSQRLKSAETKLVESVVKS